MTGAGSKAADSLAARTAIVTGGTRGIGLGIATALAAEGWQLVVSGVRPAADVAGTLDALTAAGAAVHYCASDIAVTGDRARLVAESLARFGAIDALVNNAGRAPAVRADILDAGEESFETLLRTNLQGPYFLTQLVARHMLERGRGAGVVFVTSVSAELASINRGDYCVSKAGLAMTARLFALRLASSAIPVFEVRPGVIATDMTARVKDVYDQRIADGLVPEGRWGTPADVGRVVAALLRGDAPYATGSVVHVDGGLALGRL
jgi:3-oxoacyl-[acyl-carrier protein] reductase